MDLYLSIPSDVADAQDVRSRTETLDDLQRVLEKFLLVSATHWRSENLQEKAN
jgi:hypothetical protein